ncbi:MAG TPA: tripartite tricarboxylate transporter substrate binding protein [Burkholderiales bacterium]|nr:tripartite tricarboxylate transporter substrate binding protein [Burkholderiales bacterium]
MLKTIVITTAVVAALGSSLAVGQAASTGSGQAYPTRPIRLIIGVPPGGAADFTARIVAQKLSDGLGQNLVAENRGGAGGTIASDITAKASPDGYTLLWSSSTTHGVGPVLYTHLPYDADKDFTHIALATSLPMYMVVHQSVPAKSVKELVALAKAKPESIHFYSSGSGGMPHLVGEMFKAAASAPIVHVPYKGSGPGVVDLAAGNVQLGFDSLPSIYPHVQSGRLRVLATVGGKRSSKYPDVPSLAESGYPQVDGMVWYGISGPARMPKPLVDRISGELKRILALADVRERFGQQGADATYLAPDAFLAFMRAEWKKWGPVVKATGARAD